jgi:hypothetical protein
VNGLVFGKRRRGKTTLTLHLARLLGLTICVFDVNRQFRYAPEATVSTEDDLRALLLGGEPEIIFRPGLDVKAEFEIFAGVVNQFEAITTIVDEASRLQRASWIEPALDVFIRHYKFETNNLIQALHRPQDAATISREVATDWYFFRTKQPRSLEAIAEQTDQEVAEAVAALQEREYVHWSDDDETWEKVTAAGSWFERLEEAEPVLVGPAVENSAYAIQ